MRIKDNTINLAWLTGVRWCLTPTKRGVFGVDAQPFFLRIDCGGSGVVLCDTGVDALDAERLFG